MQPDATSVNWPRRGCKYGCIWLKVRLHVVATGCIQYFCKYFQKFGIFEKDVVFLQKIFWTLIFMRKPQSKKVCLASNKRKLLLFVIMNDKL